MSHRTCSLSIVCGMVLVLLSQVAAAASVNLWGLADGDSIYIEEFSGGFFRMDLYDRPPRETQQRFRDLTDPSVTFGNEAFDGFPNDEAFRLGSVEYDASSLVNGSGVAPITALNLGVGASPGDPTYINYGRWDPINTFVDSFAGTVSVTNGMPTSIDLTSAVRLEFLFGPNPVTAPGTFTVAGSRFAGYMEGEFSNLAFIWDFSGNLTTLVPEPSAVVLAVTLLGGFAAAGGLRSGG